MSYSPSRALIGNVLALTAAVAFAFSNTSASLAFHGGSNPITLAATRFVLPALVLVVWLTAQGRAVWLPKRDGWIAVALGALTAAYMARKHGVPAYVVLHDATLEGIASSRPQTHGQLRAVSGIGDKKLERYGDALLSLMRSEAS